MLSSWSAGVAERRLDRSRARPRAESGRGFPGEDDEQEDPVMKGLRDDVDPGLDDGWSQGSRTVPVSASMITNRSAD